MSVQALPPGCCREQLPRLPARVAVKGKCSPGLPGQSSLSATLGSRTLSMLRFHIKAPWRNQRGELTIKATWAWIVREVQVHLRTPTLSHPAGYKTTRIQLTLLAELIPSHLFLFKQRKLFLSQVILKKFRQADEVKYPLEHCSVPILSPMITDAISWACVLRNPLWLICMLAFTQHI